MHFTSTSTVLALLAILAPFVQADLHRAAVCVDKIGGQPVYNEAATRAACEAYRNRNTGDEQWDKCPDCELEVIGNLNVCLSEEWHIGGDEINYYCDQQNGAGSMAD